MAIKYWIGNAPSTTAVPTTISLQQASVLSTFPTTTAGTYNATALNVGTLSVTVSASVVSIAMGGALDRDWET